MALWRVGANGGAGTGMGTGARTGHALNSDVTVRTWAPVYRESNRDPEECGGDPARYMAAFGLYEHRPSMNLNLVKVTRDRVTHLGRLCPAN